MRIVLTFAVFLCSTFSDESKSWEASDKAKKFVEETIIIGFFASPYGAMYADGGYMVNTFDKGATGCGELSKILPAITDELWKRGYKDKDIKKIYGGNKMRVYREVWEGFAPEDDPISRAERDRFVNEQRQKFLQR